jgi:hypothetical protein
MVTLDVIQFVWSLGQDGAEVMTPFFPFENLLLD